MCFHVRIKLVFKNTFSHIHVSFKQMINHSMNYFKTPEMQLKTNYFAWQQSNPGSKIVQINFHIFFKIKKIYSRKLCQSLLRVHPQQFCILMKLLKILAQGDKKAIRQAMEQTVRESFRNVTAMSPKKNKTAQNTILRNCCMSQM